MKYIYLLTHQVYTFHQPCIIWPNIISHEIISTVDTACLNNLRITEKHKFSYELDDRGFESRQGWEFLSSPQRPDRFCGPPSLLCDRYQGLFPWG